MSRSLPRALRVGLPSSLLLAGACGFGTINISGISMREEDKAVREEDHPLQLSPSDVLTLQGANEGVEVVASDKEPPSLHVTFTARGRNRAESEKILERYHVSVEKSAQGVDVDSMGEPFEIAEEGMTIKIGAGIAYRATVPKGTALVARSSSGRVRVAGPVGRSDLETGYGSVSVRQVDGDLRVRSSSGSIEVARVQGKLEARSGYGSIGLADVAGPSVEAESSSGNLRLERVKAERVEARTGYGRVDLEHVEGKVEATSSSGAIDVEDSAGPLSLQSGYGSIEVDRAANGVRASTSSGHVRLKGVDGKVDARSQYGSVSVEGVLTAVEARSSSGKVSVRAYEGSKAKEPWSLVSGYGSIVLEAPADFACTLDARTSYGSVESDLPIATDAGKPAKGSLRGAVNGGGERVKLESASGSISIRSRGV